MSPWNMKNSCRKLEAFGNEQIILADREPLWDIIC